MTASRAVGDALEIEAAAALRTLGIAASVEARENLAVVIMGRDDERLTDARHRRALVAALQPLGFSHVAVEVRTDEDDAKAPDGA